MVGQYTCDENFDMIGSFYDDWPMYQTAGESSAERTPVPRAIDLTFEEALEQSHRQMEEVRYEQRRMSILEARMTLRDHHSFAEPRRVRRRISL